MIIGSVKDIKTGQPLYLANVYLSDSAGNPQMFNNNSVGGVSDFDGKYEIDNVFSGNYLTASIVGYKKQTKPLTTTVNFNLEPIIMNLPEVEIIADRIKTFNWRGWIVPGALILIVAFAALSARK